MLKFDRLVFGMNYLYSFYINIQLLSISYIPILTKFFHFFASHPRRYQRPTRNLDRGPIDIVIPAFSDGSFNQARLVV